MMLAMDAIANNTVKADMNLNILRQMENDLDMNEKISILFLIAEDYANAFTDIFNLFQKAKTEDSYIIVDYVKQYPDNWEDKVLESLCVLNNQEVIRKLKLSFENLDLQYVPNYTLYSKSINVVAKCLYRLCESLNESEQKLLLSYVKSDIPNYEPLDDVDYLELHMLYWMQIKYMTISKDQNHNMEKLLKHLEKFKDLEIISIRRNLEKFGNRLYVDIHGKTGANDKNYVHSNFPTEPSLAENNHKEKIQIINNGLCVIINQKSFGREYETRDGTDADCINLSKTFEAFGFQVKIYKNLKRKEMLETIKNIPKDYGNKYDCLLLCILSHGYKGGIISSDEKEVSLEEIEGAVCCMELKDVIKVVVVQACQGKTCGSINNCLKTDGLSDSVLQLNDLRQFTKFLLFISTIQGFVSIRHMEQGSWFIQEFCDVFKTYGNQLSFLECARKIIKSMREKSAIKDGTQIAQLPEIRNYRLDSDFRLMTATASVL